MEAGGIWRIEVAGAATLVFGVEVGASGRQTLLFDLVGTCSRGEATGHLLCGVFELGSEGPVRGQRPALPSLCARSWRALVWLHVGQQQPASTVLPAQSDRISCVVHLVFVNVRMNVISVGRHLAFSAIPGKVCASALSEACAPQRSCRWQVLERISRIFD